jgi:ATP-dependent Lon protease
LPVVALARVVVLPGIEKTLTLERAASLAAIEAAAAPGRRVLVATYRDPDRQAPGLTNLHPICVEVEVLSTKSVPKGQTVTLAGLRRRRLLEATQEQPYARARHEAVVEGAGKAAELAALRLVLLEQVKALAAHDLAELTELRKVLERDLPPATFVDQLILATPLEDTVKAELVGELDPAARARQLLSAVADLLASVRLETELESHVDRIVDAEERARRTRAKIAVLEARLPQARSGPAADWKKRIDESGMSEDARREADTALERLRRLPPQSSEHAQLHAYLESILGLPWTAASPESKDLALAREILDRGHHGLQQVKERILEHLAVAAVARQPPTTILCLCGPPGTGKTSLGQAIADATGRKFERISLGGIGDEAQIRGHRRTYIGALPGEVIKTMSRAGTVNPVILLDEIDKLGRDSRGDPGAALLEVLDPAQNARFRDHYLGFEYDLSRVMFIGTCNAVATMPPALLDRLELVQLAPYTYEERLVIAKRHLWRRHCRAAGLPVGYVAPDDMLASFVRTYRADPGLRSLERVLEAVCRRIAVQHVSNGSKGAAPAADPAAVVAEAAAQTEALSSDTIRVSVEPDRLVGALEEAGVVEQGESKRLFAAAAAAHYARFHDGDAAWSTNLSSVIVCYGPAGVGKTALVQACARSLRVPFVRFDARLLATDPSGVLSRAARDLFEAAHADPRRAETGILCVEQVDRGRDAERGRTSGVGTLMEKLVAGALFTRSVPFDVRKLLFVLEGRCEELMRANRRPRSADILTNYGFHPEFSGHVTAVVPFEQLSVAALRQILNQGGVLAERTRLLARRGLAVRPEPGGLDALVAAARARGWGARGLDFLLSEVLQNAVVERPEQSDIVLDAALVAATVGAPAAEQQDLWTCDIPPVEAVESP